MEETVIQSALKNSMLEKDTRSWLPEAINTTSSVIGRAVYSLVMNCRMEKAMNVVTDATILE